MHEGVGGLDPRASRRCLVPLSSGWSSRPPPNRPERRRTGRRRRWPGGRDPAKARRVRKETIARLLKRHRVRCIDAGEVFRRLREPAIPVAPGTTEAAVAHIRRCAVERRRLLAGANPARQLSLQPVAIGAGDGGNDMA